MSWMREMPPGETVEMPASSASSARGFGLLPSRAAARGQESGRSLAEHSMLALRGKCIGIDPARGGGRPACPARLTRALTPAGSTSCDLGRLLYGRLEAAAEVAPCHLTTVLRREREVEVVATRVVVRLCTRHHGSSRS